MNGQQQNVIWAVEWIKTNGANGKRWKLKSTHIDRHDAVLAMTQYQIHPDHDVGGWKTEYRIAPYIRAEEKVVNFHA